MAPATCFASALLTILAVAPPAGAAQIPGTVVPSDGSVVSFVTATDWQPTDILNVSVTGTVFILAGNEIGTNGAGIVTHSVDPAFFQVDIGDLLETVYPYAEGAHLGSLILGISPDLSDPEWIQLFRPTAGNGLGSAMPPTTLSSARTLADYGGFLAASIPSGTTLYLSVADFFHGDNSGSLAISSVPESSTAVTICMALSLLSCVRMRSRRK